LGSWARQCCKPESKLYYFAFTFCSLKGCRGHLGLPRCEAELCLWRGTPFPHGDPSVAVASQGALAGVPRCGRLGCPARERCGAGLGHLFLAKDCVGMSFK